jgi:hypothetical protein
MIYILKKLFRALHQTVSKMRPKAPKLDITFQFFSPTICTDFLAALPYNAIGEGGRGGAKNI